MKKHNTLLSALPAWYYAREETEFLARRLTESAGQEKGIVGAVLFGPPGVGKTSFASALAEGWEAELITFVAHHWVSDELFIVALDPAWVGAMAGGLVDPSPGRAWRLGVLPTAAIASWLGRVVVLLDEWDKAPPPADVLLLEFLQEGTARVPAVARDAVERALSKAGIHSDCPEWIRPEGSTIAIRANPSSLLVLLTSNEERPLADPLLRRVRRLRMGFLPPEVEMQVLRKETGAPPGLCRGIVETLNRMRKYASDKGLSLPSLPEGIRLARDLMAARSFEEARAAVEANLARSQMDLAWLREADVASALWGEVTRARRASP